MSGLTPQAREALEARVAAAVSAGDVPQALALLVEGYGPDVLSFLAALLGDREQAAEVFSQTCEDLVRTFPRFRGECSYRTWLYALARTASRRHREKQQRPEHLALSQAPELEQVRRTTTAAFLRTEWKDRLRGLRETLPPSERALLVLRVDRGLSWDEIAHVLADDEDGPPTAATLRKRFERVKGLLKERAKDAGWPLE